MVAHALEPDADLPERLGVRCAGNLDGLHQCAVELGALAFAELHHCAAPATRIHPRSGYLLGDRLHSGVELSGPSARERFEGLDQEIEAILEPLPCTRAEGRPGGELPAAFLHREEAHPEVPAVDGGDVAGLERLEGTGVVPVQEVTAVALEALERIEAVAQPGREIGQAQISEVPGAER